MGGPGRGADPCLHRHVHAASAQQRACARTCVRRSTSVWCWPTSSRAPATGTGLRAGCAQAVAPRLAGPASGGWPTSSTTWSTCPRTRGRGRATLREVDLAQRDRLAQPAARRPAPSTVTREVRLVGRGPRSACGPSASASPGSPGAPAPHSSLLARPSSCGRRPAAAQLRGHPAGGSAARQHRQPAARGVGEIGLERHDREVRAPSRRAADREGRRAARRRCCRRRRSAPLERSTCRPPARPGRADQAPLASRGTDERLRGQPGREGAAPELHGDAVRSRRAPLPANPASCGRAIARATRPLEGVDSDTRGRGHVHRPGALGGLGSRLSAGRGPGRAGVCGPSARPSSAIRRVADRERRRRRGCTRSWRLASFAAKLNEAAREAVRPDGPAVIEVSGGVRASVEVADRRAGGHLPARQGAGVALEEIANPQRPGALPLFAVEARQLVVLRLEAAAVGGAAGRDVRRQPRRRRSC